LIGFLGLSPEEGKRLASELSGHAFLPISAVIGDVAGQMLAWGGDLKKFEHVRRIEIQALSAEQFVKDTLKESGVQFSDPKMQARLEFIMTSFVKGARDSAETKAVLMRSVKVGGLALDEQAADHLISVMDEKKKFAKVDFGPGVTTSISPPSGRGESQPAPEPLTKPVLNLTGAPAKTTAGLGAPSPERAFLEEHPEEQEKKLAGGVGRDVFGKEDADEIARIASATKAKIAASPLMSQEDAINRIVSESALTLDEEMKKRFISAVDSRLRDIRDAYETRAQLESAKEQGGLGLSGAALAKTMEVIERVTAQWQTQAAALVAKKPEQAPTAEPVKAPPSGKAETSVAKPAAPPKPVAPKLSPQSVPAAPGRPRVEDVKFARKLAGPHEELAALTLVEFRRLSTDPKEAIMKIKDKIDLLEEQGYEKKIQAIKAWRESPLNVMNLALARDALISGRSIQQIIEEKRKKGEDTLTPDEVKALGSLNAELRF
jgi:hypothetical protein